MRVRGMVATVLLAGALLGCSRTGSGPAAGSASAIAWEKDLSGALVRAESEKKLVMVEFYTDWCRWCDVMDEKTFANGAVQAVLKRLIVVKLDAERGGRDAARRYGVQGFPTVVFLDATGKEVGRIPGYLPAEPFLEELGDILEKA